MEWLVALGAVIVAIFGGLFASKKIGEAQGKDEAYKKVMNQATKDAADRVRNRDETSKRVDLVNDPTDELLQKWARHSGDS